MRRVVVVVLDGMRRDLLDEAHTPALARFARRSRSFTAHRSMFPSATRVVSASFARGEAARVSGRKPSAPTCP